MNHLVNIALVSSGILSTMASPPAALAAEEPPFQDSFPAASRLQPRGINPYFIPLVPGFKLLLQGESDGETETALLAVLRSTAVINGVRCAIVQETEWLEDELVEIAWNYYAISPQHGSVFYFGEDVNHYENGEVIGHDGSWRAGVNGARISLAMPGYPVTGAR